MRIKAIVTIVIFLLTISLTVAQDEPPTSPHYYFGVDLSYVNEMDDCGAAYRVDGAVQDAYQIFADNGANLVRIRLWHTPDWTDYSTFDDVVRSFQRADALGMDTLLDFHYSDTWADPSRQNIPAAWADIDSTEALGQALYDYTFDVLMRLDDMGIMPEMVQVGNEINSEILRQPDSAGYPIDWERNGYLINQAIRAVRDVGMQTEHAPQIIIHIAQPDEVEGWLLAATNAGVTDFDIIGLSYYTGWSDHSLTTLGGIINRLRYRFGKEVLIVETAYPWTMGGVSESAGNIPGQDFVEDDYPATPSGQRVFMIDLTQVVISSGGLGVVYWEPAWVSTDCFTQWGQGSHWENATFFDFRNGNEVLEGIEFLNFDYDYPVNVTLQFTFGEGDPLERIAFWGDFTGGGRRPMFLTPDDAGIYSLTVRVMPGTTIRYQFYSDTPISTDTALVSGDCVDEEGYVELIAPSENTVLHHLPDTCPE